MARDRDVSSAARPRSSDTGDARDLPVGRLSAGYALTSGMKSIVSIMRAARELIRASVPAGCRWLRRCWRRCRGRRWTRGGSSFGQARERRERRCEEVLACGHGDHLRRPGRTCECWSLDGARRAPGVALAHHRVRAVGRFAGLRRGCSRRPRSWAALPPLGKLRFVQPLMLDGLELAREVRDEAEEVEAALLPVVGARAVASGAPNGIPRRIMRWRATGSSGSGRVSSRGFALRICAKRGVFCRRRR